MNGDEEMGSDRRRFLRACGCALAGLTVVGVAPIIGGCEYSHLNTAPPDSGGDGRTVEIDVSGMKTDRDVFVTSKLGILGPDGNYLVIVRKGPTEFRVMSTECTHSGFVVVFDNENGFVCTGGQGHGSRFDLDGNVLSGPAVPYGNLRTYQSQYDASRGVLTVRIG
jgi:Rieske Fe-S protein